ncbi:MAG: S9 family peptidase [Bacteroidia bacterium]
MILSALLRAACLALCLAAGLLSAQDSLIDLRAVFTGQLSPARIDDIQWRSDGTFTYRSPDGQTLMRGDREGRTAVFVSLDDLNASLTYPLAYMPTVSWQADNRAFDAVYGSALLHYDLDSRDLRIDARLPAGATLLEAGPGGTYAFVLGDNIHIGQRRQPGHTPITTDGSPDLRYGEAAHRNEFGITKGLFWSPTGDKLAFYRIDQHAVPGYTLVDQLSLPAATNVIRYPMAGDSSHYASIGVYDRASGKTIYLQTGQPLDQYLTNLTWSPDGKRIYLAVVNRAQDHLWLRAYDPADGRLLHTLFEETDPRYVEPERGLHFVPGQPDRFVWFSERDGYDHLYLYTTKGKLLRQLTQGAWVVQTLLGFDAAGENVYFTATKASPVEEHIYAVSLDKGEIVQLSVGAGVHSGAVSPGGDYLLDSWSSMTEPGRTVLRNLSSGQEVATIHQADDPLAGYRLGETTLVPLDAGDGTTLYAHLYRSRDFDPAQRYPVLVYVYGGPHVQLIRNEWQVGTQLFLQRMAQRGYVVFSIDTRGSANRGRDFEQAVYRQFGTQEMADVLAGVTYLRSQPYVDSTRMAVYGWSFGGFLTTSLMLRQPGLFRVGVAGGPVIDWRLYEVMYTERYMDTPQENPEGYAKANLLNYIDRLQGRLFIIHGQQDDVVLPQHSFQLLRKAEEQRVQVDYYPYATYPHNVRGIDRAHLFEKIARYIDEGLR